MKARQENGQIKIYNELPSQFFGVTGSYAGGFYLVDESILKQEGFFDVVTPSYNQILEILSPIYFDQENQVFTYKVEANPNLPTLEQAKINKIAELKMNGRAKFNETDWYYTRELRMKELGVTKEVPPEVVEETRILYSLLDSKEAKINSLADLESVLTFDVSLDTKSQVEEVVVEKSTTTETPKEAEVPKEGEVDLSAYNVALLAVKEEDYTKESWGVYQAVVSENSVTSANTQQEVDTAVTNIKDAQNKLELLLPVTTTPSSPIPNMGPATDTSSPISGMGPDTSASAPSSTASSTTTSSPSSESSS